jgi:putative iron-dependent peroxidase
MCLRLRAEADGRAARSAMASLATLLDKWRAGDNTARNCWAMGLGLADWVRLMDLPPPPLLGAFPLFDDALVTMPSTPYSVFVHLRSERFDLCFTAGEAVCAALKPQFELAEAIPGFRYLDGRDLTGFVDGTENPGIDARPQVALVEDEPWRGGSYLHIQRYVHDLAAWRALPEAVQEGVIGRTKQDDVELDDAAKAGDAHIARVVIEEDGKELEIVRQSMPYGVIGGEQGLMFVSYARTPQIFERMLARMATARDGHSDALLRYTQAVSGAAFFVPPRALLGDM